MCRRDGRGTALHFQISIRRNLLIFLRCEKTTIRPQGKNSKKKRGAVIKGAMYESSAESVEGSPFYLMQQSRDPYAKLAKIQNYSLG